MSTSRPSNKSFEYVGAFFILVLGSAVVTAVYQISTWINNPHPTKAHDWSDREVENQIQQFVFDSSLNTSWRQLRSIPERTQQSLLKILADNTTSRDFVTASGPRNRHSTPLSRVCALFPDGPEAAPAAPLLVPYLSVSHEKTKAILIQLLISTGHQDAAPAIEIGLRSEHLRWRTLETIRSLKQDGALSSKIETHVWSILEGLIKSDEDTQLTASVMLELNSERAVSFFASPEIFDFSNPKTERILST